MSTLRFSTRRVLLLLLLAIIIAFTISTFLMFITSDSAYDDDLETLDVELAPAPPRRQEEDIDLHAEFDWRWYERHVLNASHKEVVCGPPATDEDDDGQDGYSLIECYVNPLYDGDLQNTKFRRMKTQRVQWPLSKFDTRRIWYYSMCTLRNVSVEWQFARKPYVAIFAHCRPTRDPTIAALEARINLNRAEAWRAHVGDDGLHGVHRLRIVNTSIRHDASHASESDDGLIYHVVPTLWQCGTCMFRASYAFANPWHCLDVMLRQFAMAKYLNQRRTQSVLLLPSQQETQWKRNYDELADGIPRSNFYFLYALFRLFVPFNTELPHTPYMTAAHTTQLSLHAAMNEQFVEQTFEHRHRDYRQLRKPVATLQLNMEPPMQFQPFFEYAMHAPLLHEYRKYLSSYLERLFAGYAWQQSLVDSDFFCFAFHAHFHCNQRSDLNLSESAELRHASIIYFKHQLMSASVPILFVGDRSICGQERCECSIRRCVHASIHSEWLRRLFTALSSRFLIVYGNPAYLSFETHFYLMRHAHLFVSVHGASMALMLFMHAPQKVYELYSKSSQHLAAMLDIAYYGYPVVGSAYIGTDVATPVVFDVEAVIHTLALFAQFNASQPWTHNWQQRDALCKAKRQVIGTFCK